LVAPFVSYTLNIPPIRGKVNPFFKLFPINNDTKVPPKQGRSFFIYFPKTVYKLGKRWYIKGMRNIATKESTMAKAETKIKKIVFKNEGDQDGMIIGPVWLVDEFDGWDKLGWVTKRDAIKIAKQYNLTLEGG
jgi:hypothetical protein